jgi:predicted Zn finger-like uncharacterized protein
MDVRCSRCATEYEFDDALISERGTTVKCTNCGFQFKIFPPKAGAVAPERWLVRTSDQREMVYTSLRELQRGISERQVGPNDLLSRGNAAPRPLGSIPELEPFFAATSVRVAQRAPRTLHGVAPPAIVPGGGASNPQAAPPSSAANAMAATMASSAPLTPAAAPVTRQQPEQSPLSATLPAQPPAFSPKPPDPSFLTPPSAQEPPRRSEPQHAPVSSPLAAPSPASFRTPAIHQPSSQRLPEAAPPSARRQSFASYDEFPVEGQQESGRHARSRWIAAIVILGVVALFAATVGRQYLVRSAVQPTTSASPAPDNRVERFLAEGAKLLHEGDFEGAKEQLVKAQTLADKNPAVLASLARLETMRADMYWLKLRLLDPTSVELVQSTHRELGRRVGKARQAVDAAFAVAPEDTDVVRARVDVLRLSGEADKARDWVTTLSSNAADPENAYAIAALDLAAPEPKWPSLVQQLQKSAAAGNVRARAALIYALVQSGAIEEAQGEFSKLEGEEKPHPLFDELKTFVQRVKGASRDAGPSAVASAAPVATVDVSKLPALDTSQGPEPARGSEAAAPAGDFRKRLVQASNALRAGDLPQAQTLYQSVLNEQPGNTEALSGLADVARRRNDHATASRLYQKVLEQNPSYVPALMASADSKWAAGDRKGAVALYRRVLEQAGPGGEYGQRASARIAEAAKDSGDAAAPPPTAAPTPDPAPAPDQPHIDTSDLPGFNK